VQRGERGLLLTAYAEGHTKLLAHLRPLAFFNEPAVGDTVTLLSLPSLLGMSIDTATSAITTTIRQSGARLVVVDGFQGIADQLIDSMALRRLLAAVATQLTYLDVTLLLTLTGTAREEPTTSGLTSADVVLGLHYGLDGIQHTRRIEVLKQRGRAHLPGTHSLVHVKESAMRRKLWIISLVLVVTFGTLTACGGNGDDEDEDEDDEGRRRAPQVALVHP
jgi:circadian clock protein KaiC